MRSRRENGPLIARTSGHSIDRRTADRARRRAPRSAHHHARRSTRRPAMHLAPPHGHHFNQTPAPSLTAHRHPPARRHRPNARPSPVATRGRIRATTREPTDGTARHRDRAPAIARLRGNHSSNATRVIANPTDRRSSPHRASPSARPRGLRQAQPSARRNGRRSARPNRNVGMWRGLFATMTTTNAAPSTIKPKPRPAACACRSG